MCLLKRHNNRRTGTIMCLLRRQNDIMTEGVMTKETRGVMAKDRRVREYRTCALNFYYITVAKTPLRKPKNSLFERLCN